MIMVDEKSNSRSSLNAYFVDHGEHTVLVHCTGSFDDSLLFILLIFTTVYNKEDRNNQSPVLDYTIDIAELPLR